MAQTPISALTAGNPLGTDEIPAVDVTDLTQASTGTTKRYYRWSDFNFTMYAQGYSVLPAVLGATTTDLTATYNNGTSGVGATLTNASTQAAFSVDGVAFVAGSLVLIKNQIDLTQNGIYTVSNIGSAITNWVLTRATFYDTPAQIIENQIVLVNAGTVNVGLAYQMISSAPYVIGATPLVWATINQSASSGFQWFDITNTSQTMSADNGYVTDNAGLVTLTLPAVAAFGTMLKIVGKGAGGWSIAQNFGQHIQIGHSASTSGVGGSVSSTNQYDSLELICTTANTVWTAQSGPMSSGLTIV